MNHWRRMAAICLCAVALPHSARAQDTVRIATFNAELQRDGPGLLLRDIRRGADPQINAAIAVIASAKPDVLALQGFDWDYEGQALSALSEELKRAGAEYPFRFAARPNTGMATELDLDGDGRLGEPEDAQGYGEFSGQGGIAILSRIPILTAEVTDFTAFLWRDLPGAIPPRLPDGSPFPSPEAHAIQRLSSTAHWVVPFETGQGQRFTLMTFQAGPPVFDGPEDRNGRRNHDEILFWRAYLDGTFGPAPDTRFIIAGGANLDPYDSDGRREAIRTLLSDPRLTDPAPESPGAAAAPDQGHRGANARDTVDWQRPGRMRVDYILPSADWRVVDAQVFWPARGEPGHDAALAASRHRLVWVDLRLD